jgi:Ankyrin repeats (3 copies)
MSTTTNLASDAFVNVTSSADAVRAWLAKGHDPQAERDALCPLHLACATGSLDIVNVLLDAGAIPDIEAWPIGASRWLEWHWLSKHGHRSFAGEYGRGARGLTPLHIACDRGDTVIIRRLLDAGADPYVSVLLDCGPEGDWLWTPQELVRGQCNDLLVNPGHQTALALLQEWMTTHPPTLLTAARSRRRREACV